MIDASVSGNGARHRSLHLSILYCGHSAGALALQVSVAKAAGLTFGMDLPATTMSFAAFIAGAALGAGLVRSGIRVASPRVAFACIQVGLALACLILPGLLQSSAATLLGTRLESCFSFGLMLLPAVLIGMAFPVLARSADSLDSIGKSNGLGRLYARGTLASAAGAWLGAVVWLPWLGTYHSIHLLAAWFAVLAAAALLLPEIQLQQRESKKELGARSFPPALGVTAMLGGFALLSGETAWLLALWRTIDPTPYVTGTVIATVILCMGLGAAAGTALLRRLHPSQVISLSIFAGAASTLFTLVLGEGPLRAAFQALQPGSGMSYYLAGAALTTFILLGLPMALQGSLISGLLTAAKEAVGNQARASSSVVALHNAGAAAAAVLTPFVLIPMAGVAGTVALAAAALALSLPFLDAGRPRGMLTSTAAVCITMVVGNAAGHAFDGNSLQLIYQREDGSGLTQVIGEPDGRQSLLTNRLRHQGGDSPQQVSQQRLQGHIPWLLQAPIRRILVIGLGTGSSLAALGRSGAEHLICVELSHGVAEAARHHFQRANDSILDDHRVELHIADGHRWVRQDQREYDLIFQDLFFPYGSGASSLYTLEHFKALRARLAPAGRVAQWIPLAQLGPEQLRILTATFLEVFPYAQSFLNGGYLCLIGSLIPIQVDLGRVQAALSDDALASDLKFSGIREAADLMALALNDTAGLGRMAAGAPLQTENHLRIEYGAPRLSGRLNTPTLIAANLALLGGHLGNPAALVRGNADSLQRVARRAAMRPWLLKALGAQMSGQRQVALQYYRKVLEYHPRQPQALPVMEQHLLENGILHLKKGRFQAAEDDLRLALTAAPESIPVRLSWGVAQARLGRDRTAVEVYRKILKHSPGQLQARYNLGLSLYRLGHYEEAARCFEEILASNREDADARFHLANSLARLELFDESVRHYRLVLARLPDHQRAKSNLKSVLAALGRPDQPQN